MMEIERTKRLLEVSLGVRPGESVLVVTDDSTEAIGRMVWRAALALDAQAVLMTMPTATHSGVEPPEVVAAAMARADVVIAPTAHSITHTNARRIAVEHGARLATMPGITEDMFVRGAVTADYDEVERLTLQLTALLDAADSARIEKDGLTLHFDLRGRGGVPSTGKYLLPGQSGNLPSGEAYIAPVENGTHGEIIVDGSFVGLGKLDAPLRLRIENGVLQSVQGPRSDELGILFDRPENGTVGELGIGTNREASLTGIILEDEKIYGTVHVAFGTNITFGGTNEAGCHLDGVILQPTLYIGEQKVLDQGVFVL